MAQETLPTEVGERRNLFDRFADGVSRFTSKAWFFSACVALIVVWAPTILIFQVDTWQLIINTATTIVTFLLVALFQNTTTRDDAASQQKLNALAKSNLLLLDVLGHGETDEARQLRAAIGVEKKESAD